MSNNIVTIYEPTLDEVNGYMNNRLNADPWFDATEDDQLKAISTAIRSINNLSLDKSINSEQGIIDTIAAVSEVCISLLDGVDPSKEIDSVNVISRSFVSSKVTYDKRTVPEHTKAGIVSPIAWNILWPYLIANLSLSFIRVT